MTNELQSPVPSPQSPAFRLVLSRNVGETIELFWRRSRRPLAGIERRREGLAFRLDPAVVLLANEDAIRLVDEAGRCLAAAHHSGRRIVLDLDPQVLALRSELVPAAA